MRSTRFFLGLATSAAGLLLLTLPSSSDAKTLRSTSPPACTAGTTVRTTDGAVCGITRNRVTDYLGIPYAAPPVGKLRWRAPRPIKPWGGVLQATRPGNICTAPGFHGGMVGNEDCLNLNVQVPAGTRPDAGLPVMVRIHGGGFLVTAFGLHDSAYMAREEHMIVVAMNYRLGIMGFLAEKALGPHSGDYGLQDQQAGLRWVQRNIARFGGDPRNVTIDGTSAGGASVCAQAISPAAKGLFERGISRSGFYNAAVGPNQVWEAADCKSQLPTEAQAQRSGASLAAKLGCGHAGNVAACLREKPAATVVEAASQILAPDTDGTIAPTINGTTLPMSPAKAFATGRINPVSLIIGVDRDETNGGVTAPPVVASTSGQYRKLVKEKYGSLAAQVMRLYPIDRFPRPSAFIAFRTIVADADSVCPELVAFQKLSRHIPVYAYEVDDAGAPVTYLSGQWPWGAYHGTGGTANPGPGGARSELGQDADHLALTHQVRAEWGGFARTGDPTAPGAPYWPRYTLRNPMVMSLNPAGDSVLVPATLIASQHHCGFWDSVTPAVLH